MFDDYKKLKERVSKLEKKLFDHENPILAKPYDEIKIKVHPFIDKDYKDDVTHDAIVLKVEYVENYRHQIYSSLGHPQPENIYTILVNKKKEYRFTQWEMKAAISEEGLGVYTDWKFNELLYD